MPAFWGYPPLPHDCPYDWVILDSKSKEDKVKVTNLKNLPKFWNKLYTRHTFQSCLIRCANMKWIQQASLKIQSGHDLVHRQTDGQGETSIPPFQLHWNGGYKNAWYVTTTKLTMYNSIIGNLNLLKRVQFHYRISNSSTRNQRHAQFAVNAITD